MYYIRFTSDIHADLERGASKDFRNGENLSGLCAWGIGDMNLTPASSDAEIIESAQKMAGKIARNTYGGYDNNGTYAVLEGRYTGSSNDGVCIEVDRVISIETL